MPLAQEDWERCWWRRIATDINTERRGVIAGDFDDLNKHLRYVPEFMETGIHTENQLASS